MKLILGIEFVQEEIINVAACCGRIQLASNQLMEIVGKTDIYMQCWDSAGNFQYRGMYSGDILYSADIWEMADVNDELQTRVYQIVLARQ